MYDVVANFKSTCHGSYLWKGSRHESFSLNQVIFQSFQLYNRNRHWRELSILANENQSFELPKDKGHVFQNTHVCEWNSLYYSYVLQKYLWPHFSHYEYGGYNRVVITYNRQNAAHHLIVSLYKQTHTQHLSTESQPAFSSPAIIFVHQRISLSISKARPRSKATQISVADGIKHAILVCFNDSTDMVGFSVVQKIAWLGFFVSCVGVL